MSVKVVGRVRSNKNVLCDCGRPAYVRVRVTQLKIMRSGMHEFSQTMTLCRECYREFLVIEGHEVSRRVRA